MFFDLFGSPAASGLGRRHAQVNRVGRDVLRHDGTRADDTAPANAHSLEDCRATSDPDVIFNSHVLIVLREFLRNVVQILPDHIEAVIATHDCHIRTKQDLVADANDAMGSIEARTRAYIHGIADLDILKRQVATDAKADIAPAFAKQWQGHIHPDLVQYFSNEDEGKWKYTHGTRLHSGVQVRGNSGTNERSEKRSAERP